MTGTESALYSSAAAEWYEACISTVNRRDLLEIDLIKAKSEQAVIRGEILLLKHEKISVMQTNKR